MTAEKKSYIALIISIITIVGAIVSGAAFIYNSGGSAKEIKLNASEVPGIKSDVAEIKGDMKEIKTTFKDHIEQEKQLRKEDREDRKEMIVTNKLLIDALNNKK